jgi:hypothetical protein
MRHQSFSSWLSEPELARLLSCLTSCVSSIAGGFSIRLETGIARLFFGRCALFLRGLIRRLRFTRGFKAGLFRKALRLPFSRTNIARGAHGCPSRPPFGCSRVVKPRSLAELCHHGLLRALGIL